MTWLLMARLGLRHRVEALSFTLWDGVLTRASGSDIAFNLFAKDYFDYCIVHFFLGVIQFIRQQGLDEFGLARRFLPSARHLSNIILPRLLKLLQLACQNFSA